MQQGSRRTDLDLALTIAQALREDGYGERVIRIMEAAYRVEVMADQTEYVSGELRRPVATVFPGDPSLTEMTEEEAQEQADAEAELARDSQAFADALAAPELGEDGPQVIDPFEMPGERS
jgi:hypothetical protein